MKNEQMRYTRELCTLIRCALTSRHPNWEGMELGRVYLLAKSHSLSAISFMALEGTEARDGMEEALYARWQQEKETAVRRQLLFSAEYGAIAAALEELQCWYMPLKGAVLSALYPKVGMRQMADTDILFDPAFRQEVKTLFEERGYQCESYGILLHDVYIRKPVYNYEMHVALFGYGSAGSSISYYEHVEERLLSVGGFERGFSKEDFYIYLLAHGHKHFINYGNGLRFLVDSCVYRRQFPLDWDYVKGELEKIGLAAFEEETRVLSDKLFESGEPLTAAEEGVLERYAVAGTYGTMETRVSNTLAQMEGKGGKWKRLRYLLRRLIPEQAWFENYVPFFAKHRALKPAFLLWRVLRGMALNGRSVTKEIKVLFGARRSGTSGDGQGSATKDGDRR